MQPASYPSAFLLLIVSFANPTRKLHILYTSLSKTHDEYSEYSEGKVPKKKSMWTHSFCSEASGNMQFTPYKTFSLATPIVTQGYPL